MLTLACFIFEFLKDIIHKACIIFGCEIVPQVIPDKFKNCSTTVCKTPTVFFFKSFSQLLGLPHIYCELQQDHKAIKYNAAIKS
jgi:hypothetical protein